MFSVDVSWIGVVLATVASVIIGAFIYSPKVLGSIWCRAYGWDADQLKPSPLHYGGAVLVAFVMSFFLAVLLKALHITSVWQGVETGFIIWIGFIVPTFFSGVIWSKKPLMAYGVDIVCELAILVVSGFILAFFS